MQHLTTVLPACLAALLCACTNAQPEDAHADPKRQPAPAGDAPPTPAVGEVVRELGDGLWIIFQDRQGTTWFGTDGDGLYRVDGNRILRFTTKDGLCSDRVRQILEDTSGNLYFNTLGGISTFDGQRFRTLVPVQAGSALSAWSSQPGDLWFQGNQDDNGPYRYDGRTLHHHEFPKHELEPAFLAIAPHAPFSPYQVYTIFHDSRGALWFGTSTFGVCRYDGRSLTWISEDELTELDGGPSFGVRGIVEDQDGQFWFSNLLHRYDVSASEPKEPGAPSAAYRRTRGLVDSEARMDAAPAYFMSGLKDGHGVLWFATLDAGVWRYDGNHVTRFPVQDRGQAVRLYSIYEDKGGTLWLGTTGQGAYRFDGTAFARFRP
ncbi:MAG: hypothetical protein NTY35_08950 [Planctomycetota bacterium]|nr:hypothetical protein [Planctomycetota bacterium]